MSVRSTISEQYLSQQRTLHENPNYGVASLHYAPIVKTLIEQLRITSISDYGAGKCNLRTGLHGLGLKDFEYFPYDPAFPEYGTPKPADLVCCIDVLEHIEEIFLDAVLQDLSDITRKAGFFTVQSGPAGKKLSDGSNAHLIQKPSSWWLPRFCQHFEIAQMARVQGGFWVVTERRKSI